MKPEEIAILKEWVAEGAHYRPHWAFEKPIKSPLPQIAANDPKPERPADSMDPIDPFVLARLRKEGLHPSPEADKSTLIRRVTLDLTGLLPTPEETKAFLADSSANAYERLVDRLLNAPAYGEQRTRYWLDYARYGDSYGLHNDFNRAASPYRDYLIRSFNANKPFDRFAREQIAGDLIPGADLDSIIASGYVRGGVSSDEGGAIPEELRVNLARERTEAYGAAFLGLTVGCAVCHDHKYDPTTQKDFYQLSAFFSNIDEQPFNGDTFVWAPSIRIPRPENRAAFDRVLADRSELEGQLRAMQARQASLVRDWVASRERPARPVSTDKLLLRLRLDENGGDVLRNSAPNPAPASFPVGTAKPQWGETTWLWPDFRMDTGTHILLGQTGDFEANQPFSLSGWYMIRTAPNFPSTAVNGALVSKMDTTHENRGWDLATNNGYLSVDLIDSAPQAFKTSTPPPAKFANDKVAADDLPRPASKVRARMPHTEAPVFVDSGRSLRVSTLKPLANDGKWRHIAFTYDGSGKASGVKILVDGEAVATTVISDSLGAGSIRTNAPLQLGWRYPDAAPARETRYQDLRLYGRALSPEEAGRLPYEDYAAELISRPMASWNEDQWHAIGAFYLDRVDPRSQALSRQIAADDVELERLSSDGTPSLVSREKPSIAYANVLARGVYSNRTERVEANTPHFLPPLPAGQPHDRLALAEWTVSPENPLTARVTVNRMWNELFGTGLVETTEDFGIMGQRASNPELLDWLAVEFRQSGWNVKHMYKLMVMSATYRQSARSTREQLTKDPRNLLLAHGPRFRMDAEMLRDVALQSSGLLENKIGGPSVRPYQPENVWETVGSPVSNTTHYQQQHGDALYRRSLYTYWKRMAIMPDMDAFDAPARDTACTRRQRTDTPLQALVTMNDVQWVEASRALAQRLIQEGGTQPQQRINYLSEILLARDATPGMLTTLESSLAKMQQHYTADPKAARELIAVGEKPRNPAIPAPELAAWTMVVSEMLNLDETLNK
jgi:hypothetical protein